MYKFILENQATFYLYSQHCYKTCHVYIRYTTSTLTIVEINYINTENFE